MARNRVCYISSMFSHGIGTVGFGLVMAMGVTAIAQQSKPAFDVVSIKRTTTELGPSNFNDAEGGHFAAQNVSLEQLIRIAYGVRPAGQEYSDLTGMDF
jgi:hypothetical protein